MYATQKAEFISYPAGVYSFWLIFTLHFVTDSKGDNDIMDVKKMCHVQQITPVLDTLILFQIAFKTLEIRFQTT